MPDGYWEAEATDEFIDWWNTLTETQQEAIDARVRLLQQRGPSLGRPTVETIKSSRHHHMKELRCSAEGVLRVLFAFDPRSAAIILLGGDKSADADGPAWNRWYDEFVPVADDLYDEHLRLLRDEGLI